MTRRKMTAFTFNVTLSRVMMSCAEPQCFLSQRDSYHSIDWREDQDYTGTFSFRQQVAQAEDNTALVFSQDFDRAEKIKSDDDNDDRYEAETLCRTSGPPHLDLLNYKDCFFRGLYRT